MTAKTTHTCILMETIECGVSSSCLTATCVILSIFLIPTHSLMDIIVFKPELAKMLIRILNYDVHSHTTFFLCTKCAGV